MLRGQVIKQITNNLVIWLSCHHKCRAVQFFFTLNSRKRKALQISCQLDIEHTWGVTWIQFRTQTSPVSLLKQRLIICERDCKLIFKDAFALKFLAQVTNWRKHLIFSSKIPKPIQWTQLLLKPCSNIRSWPLTAEKQAICYSCIRLLYLKLELTNQDSAEEES